MEPVVLPAAFPNLLVNGGTGIAVGMATNIAAAQPQRGHRRHLRADRQARHHASTSWSKFIKGPDFPTGCMIFGMAGIKHYFETGRGSVKVRGQRRTRGAQGRPGTDHRHGDSVQREPGRRWSSASRELVNEKSELTDITDVRDESDENTRVVIELKRDAHRRRSSSTSSTSTPRWSPPLRSPCSPSTTAGRRRSAQGAIDCYIEHRREVVLRRTRFQLRQAEDGPRRSKATSSRWPTSTISSGSSATPPIATRRG